MPFSEVLGLVLAFLLLRRLLLLALGLLLGLAGVPLSGVLVRALVPDLKGARARAAHVLLDLGPAALAELPAEPLHRVLVPLVEALAHLLQLRELRLGALLPVDLLQPVDAGRALPVDPLEVGGFLRDLPRLGFGGHGLLRLLGALSLLLRLSLALSPRLGGGFGAEHGEGESCGGRCDELHHSAS